MLLSHRRKDAGPAIAEFWRWWPQGRPCVEAAIADGDWSPALVAEIAGRVKAIHKGLEWEFSRGNRSSHLLVVSAAGDARLRSIAERWRRAAPPPDRHWEFQSTRQPDPDALSAALTVAGFEVKLPDLAYGFAVDSGRHEVDIVVYHPMFGQMPVLERLRVVFLALDWLLGEVAAELWIGTVETAVEPTPDMRGGEALVAAVADVAAQVDDQTWELRELRDGRRTYIASLRHPLKPVRWPHLDTHLRVEVGFPGVGDSGMPDDTTLADLRALEARLMAALGADAVLVAHETRAGRRIFHCYAEADRPTEATAAAVIGGWARGRTRVRCRPDPGWEGIRHLG
ncbi:DUF695 domain-containing protein [Polymorphospora sp. NPDC051019]|uniref:DUF695 domain-containing protein n=1 Tax=Polymorphospora sp. NPDC051019 TaxID=3155725 RepID=UPI00341E8421